MEDADWNSYRQKLCYLMHRTDICGRVQDKRYKIAGDHITVAIKFWY